MSANPPHALVTNDDGIQSFFLHRLVESLLEDGFRVTVAAPAFEQSWIGRAITRRRALHAHEAPDFPHECEAWMLDGTPSDCVNIAIGNLMPVAPDIVVSGINLGFNTTETLILSSGTVAGAIEGILWNLPAIAFSKCIPQDIFDEVRDSGGRKPGALADSLGAAADHAAKMTRGLLEQPEEAGKVVNINFPVTTRPDTPTEETVPARVHYGSLFERQADGHFSFRYSNGVAQSPAEHSDRACLRRGHISRSVLNFAAIGQRDLPRVAD